MTAAPNVKDPEQTIPIQGLVTNSPPSGSAGFDPIPQPPSTGYRIGKQLGMGGEGVVHEALQLAFGRPVAIKTLRDPEPTGSLLRRFRAEAAITALLEHPNIVPVHDLRCSSTGQLMLVLKRIAGETWRKLLDGEPPAPGQLPLRAEEHIEVLLKVCDAVSFAHSRGILHRDLKPENVMVGEHGEVLVMDWGCATHLGPKAPHPDIPVLAELRTTSGTPAYMSPEQARGDPAACGPWSDVHLLGAILYRMLTGVPPRMGSTIQATINLALRGVPADEPAIRAGHKVQSELAQIAMEALHPDPTKRTQTVDLFADALRRYIDHREVHRLLAEARRQHEAARANGPDSDDAYRRALGAVEQAVQLWPEQERARRTFVDIGLDSANHALVAGSFRLAKRQAQAVAIEAERLGDGAAIESAARVEDLADTRERQALVRNAHLLRLRRLALAASIVAGLALTVGMLAAWRESSRASAAQRSAEANLALVNREIKAREIGEALAAPALLAQARELAQLNHFAEGLPLVIVAASFAPREAAPHVLHAQLLIALQRRDEAVAQLDVALALAHDDDLAELRQLCAKPPADVDARIADVLVRLGATSAISGALNLAAEKRLGLARTQLRAAWPQLRDNNVTVLSSGTLRVSIQDSDFKIDSIEPLRGMPISTLEMLGQDRLRDLSPISSMPLTALVAINTGIRDFAPIRGLALRRLMVQQASFTDLKLLAGMPLEVLGATLPDTTTLAPLEGLPLREVRLDQCAQLTDISALAKAPLEVLWLEAPHLSSAALTDISHLRGCTQLRELSLANQRQLSDISAVRGAPLRKVVLNGTLVRDLTPIASPSLRTLNIIDSAVVDVRPLAATQLDLLDLSPQKITSGLDDLQQVASLRAINGFTRPDFKLWVELLRRLSSTNPELSWTGSATFERGRATELRLSSGVRSLVALRDQPLRLLQIKSSKQINFGPLAAIPELATLELVTCTIESLDSLANHPGLRKLSLSATPVNDLKAILTLRLEELMFTPTPKQLGLAALRNHPTLLRIGTKTTGLLPVREFWRLFDAHGLR